MSAQIEIRKLCKFYGDVEAAKDIDLVVQPGEFLTLLGPSGSGKTTTMMCIAGFTEPTSGDILIDGQSIVNLSPHKRSIGVVFQNYALFPHLTVFENVAFPLRERKVGKAEIKRRVHEALEVVDLLGRDSRKITQLSGGQQQRVALARAMVFNPPLLLMDEPLSALDKRLRDAMQIELKRIQRHLGVTVIYVTHDQAEALALSDRIAIMDEGRIQQLGTPLEVYNAPQTPFVGTFLGESNLFAAQIREADEDTVHGVTEGGMPFKAVARPGFAAGDAVSLLIRPERLQVWDADDPPGGTAPITEETGTVLREGVVRETIYLGESSRVLIDVGSEELIARVTNRPSVRPFALDDKVTVGWSRAASQIMVRNGGGTARTADDMEAV